MLPSQNLSGFQDVGSVLHLLCHPCNVTWYSINSLQYVSSCKHRSVNRDALQ